MAEAVCLLSGGLDFSTCLAWAEVLESSDVFIGVNALDYSGHPDCWREYIEAYERMANLATRAGVEGRPCAQCDACLLRRKGFQEAGIEDR
jgi:7-cyano-7-deazaguanine synthase